MLLRLLLLLTVVPLVELTILFRIAELFSWVATIALVILTGVLGAWLVRREGLKTMGRIQSDLAAGVPPAGALVDGLLILIAGAVLITPGVITDLCGFALLIAPIRARVRRRLAERFKRQIVVMHGDRRETFIDVEGRSVDANDPSDDAHD